MKTKLFLLTLVASLSVITACATPSREQSSSGDTSESSSSSSSQSSDTSSFTPTGSDINPEDPNAVETTISNLVTKNKGKSNNTTLYRITGIAQWPKNTTYGNFDLLDDTGYVYVYGCSKNKSSISKSGNTYSYSNDSTFSNMGIKPGDEITMEGLFVWYSYSSGYGVAEFQGYVTKLIHNGESTITAKSYTAGETYSGNYYSSIGSESGSTLLTKLHNLMDNTHTKWISYKSLGSYYSKTDPHSSGGVKCFYSGQKASSYNKEHVWPQSLSNSLYGEDHAGSDLHHVRPTINDYNSKRGNSMFGPVFGNKNACGKISYSGGGYDYYTGNVFEPADSIKGDVARIIMYVYMHYASTIGGASRSYYGDLRINWVMGTSPQDSWKLLRKWNAEDPVSQDEITRNNYTYSVQGNRNPFIDHPTYADRIWG